MSGCIGGILRSAASTGVGSTRRRDDSRLNARRARLRRIRRTTRGCTSRTAHADSIADRTSRASRESDVPPGPTPDGPATDERAQVLDEQLVLPCHREQMPWQWHASEDEVEQRRHELAVRVVGKPIAKDLRHAVPRRAATCHQARERRLHRSVAGGHPARCGQPSRRRIQPLRRMRPRPAPPIRCPCSFGVAVVAAQAWCRYIVA